MVKLGEPSELDAFAGESLFAEELRGEEVGIYIVPAVEVLVILPPQTVHKPAHPKIEATGKLLKSQKGFFQFNIELVVGISEDVGIDKTGKPIVDAKVESQIDALESEVIVGIVGVSADLFQ